MKTSSPKSIRGKVFVVPFTLIILFLLWLVFSMAVRFQSIMQRLEMTRSAWPAASAVFQSRYLELENAPTNAAITSNPKLNSLLTEFRKRTQFDVQANIVEKIEGLLEAPNGLHEHLQSWRTKEEIQAVLDSEVLRENLQSDFIGRCTLTGLQLDLPPIFDLKSELLKSE